MTVDAAIGNHGWPWHERLERAGRSAVSTRADPRDDAEPPATAAQWRASVDPDNAGLFAKRLAWAGLSSRDVAPLLLLDSAPRADATDWWADLEAMRDACRRSQRSVGGSNRVDPVDPGIPFAALLDPLVRWNWTQACQRRPRLRDLAIGAQESAQRTLLQGLSSLCSQGFAADFDETRPMGATLLLQLGSRPVGQEHPTAVYDEWCRRHLADGLTRMLGRFPVLGRLISVSCAQWRSNLVAMMQRVDGDRELLQAHFGIPGQEPISQVQWGLSDPHRRGRSVAIVSFGVGAQRRSIVYKPKDMRIEERFQQLVRQVGNWLDDPDWKSLAVVARGTEYGYAALAEHRHCANDDELAMFYRNTGRLLALLHLLGATDAHFENLIADGTSLHLIDAETLFQGGMVDPIELNPASADPPESVLAASVLRVGLLPCWLLGGSPMRAYDVSALGIKSVEGPMSILGWAHVNTDDMVWARVDYLPDQPGSLPVPAGVSNPLASHVDDVTAGFEQVYRLAMVPEYRESLVASVAAFTGVTRRIVLRATRVYAKVQESALSAEALADANCRAFALEKLSRNSLLTDSKRAQWQVFLSELFDMENLDIPYFEYPLGSDEVISSTGAIPGLLAGNEISEAIERINNLSDTDRAWQVRLIRGSIRARYHAINRVEEQPPIVDVIAPGDSSAMTIGAVADGLLTGLAESMIDDGASDRSWLTLSLIPGADKVRLGLIGDGLYDGRAGVAAFQFLMADLGRDGAVRADAESTVAPVLRRLDDPDQYTRFRCLRDFGLGWAGLGGLLRLFDLRMRSSTPGDMFGAPEAVSRLVCQVSADLIGRDLHRDLLAGVAGLIGPIARIHRRTPTERTASILRAAAEHLMSEQSGDGGWPVADARAPLTGLAHGASGMGMALLEAGTVLDDDRIVEAGTRAFTYERSVFNVGVGNWPDFREHPGREPGDSSFMVAWCHGAPGIGLARMRALQLLPQHPQASAWDEELRLAMDTTVRTPIGMMDHLCCGSMGRAAVLRVAGRWAREPEWVGAADELTFDVIARARVRGRFTLQLDDPSTTATTAPGLMTGVAGVGAHLASMMSDGDLSTLLL
ncbi:MAG: type 2 lanthipeptide synthetase LanM [Candidatus Nanopelagicales bacterium]|nr:type 2 lanthipeptide synthetase LanM [Candidatus Nanopelagicales bacterium]